MIGTAVKVGAIGRNGSLGFGNQLGYVRAVEELFLELPRSIHAAVYATEATNRT